MTTIALGSNFFFPEGGCRCQLIDTDKKKEQCTLRSDLNILWRGTAD